MKKLLTLWLVLASLLSLGQVKFQPLSTTATPGVFNRVAPRPINLYPINTAGNSGFMAAVNAGNISVRASPSEGAIVGRYTYSFSDSRRDYLNTPVVSDPAPVLVDGLRTAPRLVGNFYPLGSQTGRNIVMWKRLPPVSVHASKIIIYPGGLFSDTTDNALMSRGFTHTAESSKWIDGQTYPTQYRRALEMANYQAAYAAASDPAATTDQRDKLLAWAGYGSGNFEGTHTFIPDEETCKLYAKYWWATFKQNDWAGAGVDYFSVNHEVFLNRTTNYALEWYNQVGWITKEIIRLAALEGKTLKSGMSDWANLTNVNPQNFEDIDGNTGYPKYMSYGIIGEPFRGNSQSAPLGNSTVLGQLMQEGKAFVGVGSYLQHTIDDQSYFQKNPDGTYKKGSDGGLIWRTDKRTTTISGQSTVIYGDDYYKSQLKLYGRFARYHTNLYFRAGGVHLPRSDVRQPGYENVRLLMQFRLDTESESGSSPSSTGTTEAEFATLNSRPLNPDMVETDAIVAYLLTDYLRGWSESRPKTTLGANNGGKAVASAEFYAKGFHRASQLNWIFSTPWTLIQPKLWIKGIGTMAPYDANEAFYRKPIIWGGLATKDSHPTIFLNWVWPCQDTDRYTDVTVWVDKGAGAVSPGYRIRLKGRKPGLDYWTLPDALAGVQPKDIYFQFKSLLGEKITWRGDYREARITSHPTPPAVVESDLSGAAVSLPGSTTTNPGSTTVAAPSWIAGMRYSYAAPLLTLEAAGDIGAMRFDKLDGSSFSVSNPNGVNVASGNYYGPGQLDNQAPYDKQWKLFYNNTAPLRVTVQRASVSTSTFSYTVTPTAGADRVVLSGSNSSPPTNATTTGPATTAYFKNGFGEGSVVQLMASAPFTPDFSNSGNNQYSSWGSGNVYQYIDDGVVKLGISKMGGALTHISYQGGKNWINTNADGSNGVYENTTGWPDPGRSGFWSMYGTPRWNYIQNGESTSQYYDTGFNPVQGGSVYKDYSNITWFEKRTVPGYGQVLYTRSVPKQWALHNQTSGVILHCYWWIDANHVVRYFSIIENNRTDSPREYQFRQSEAPFIYPTADLWHHYVYTGSAPGTGGSLTSINPDAPQECGCPENHKYGTQTTTSEGWVAAMGDDGKGLVLIPQHNSNFHTFQVLARSGDEFSNATSYLNSATNMNFDENSTMAFSGFIYPGTMAGFRQWFNSTTIPRPGFDFTFGTRTMNGWWPMNSEAKFNSENRYQFRFRTINGGGYGGLFYAPYNVYKAADIPNIYIKGAFKNVSKILIRWFKAGQTELEGLQAPGGQSKTLDVIGDGVERTYTLPMAGTANFDGILSTIRISLEENATASYEQTFVPSYIGSKNPNN